MTVTNTAPAARPRTPLTKRTKLAPLTLLATGALALAALEMLNPAYDLVSETLSRYVHGRAGWLLPAGLLAVGTASAVLAIRLGAGFRRTGRAALLVWTAGILIAALFPADPPGHWSRPSPAELVHGNAAFLAFAALPTAAVLLHGTLAARLPDLRTALTTLTAVSVTATAALAVFLVDVMDGGPSLGLGGAPTLVGLVERLVIAADVAWVALAAAATSPRGEQRRARRA